jgi:hypothetical protein
MNTVPVAVQCRIDLGSQGETLGGAWLIDSFRHQHAFLDSQAKVIQAKLRLLGRACMHTRMQHPAWTYICNQACIVSLQLSLVDATPL